MLLGNFLWRRRQNRNRSTDEKEPSKGVSDMEELAIPPHFRCPISLDLMKDPVSLSTGTTYDRESIQKWFDSGNATCPLTNQVLRSLDQIPNHVIRMMIQDWCVQNKSYGVERIPTPRVPITPHAVSEICSLMSDSAVTGDDDRCRDLVRKIEILAKESECNRRCFVSNGIGTAFAGIMESFAHFSIEKHESLLREVLSALVWSFPLGKEGISKLGSEVSLRCMVWFLRAEDLTSRRDAVFLLRDMIYADRDFVDGLLEIQSVEEALIQIVKVATCPKVTQACLLIIHQMMLSRDHEKVPAVKLRFMVLGLIPLVLDILVDGSKSTCEKGLGVLDAICDSREGTESARSNALTLPLVVKKILRVSDTGTGFSVSILWRMIVVGGNIESSIIEAVRLGAFQKLLVVLQVGCGQRTKEKASELLKVMNMFRHKLDCFDSSMGNDHKINF